MVVGTGFSDGAVMTVGFVLSYHTFVGAFFANDSSIASTYKIQAICAQSSSRSAQDHAARDESQVEAMKQAAAAAGKGS